MKELAYLNKYLLKYKRYLIGGIVFIAIANWFSVVPAWLVREAFDVVIHNTELHLVFSGFPASLLREPFVGGLFLYGTLIVAMALVRGFFLFLMRQTIIVMSRHIEYELKNEIYDCYQRLPLSFYRKQKTGDLLARISEDVSRVRMYVGPALMSGINLLTLLLILLPVMFSINAKWATYALLPLPFLSISIYYVNNLINRKSERIQAQVSRLSTFAQEAFSGIRVVQSFAKEKVFERAFAIESNIYKQRSMSLVFVESLFFPLMLLLTGLSVVLTIYVGSIEVINGEITIGNIAEFVLYITLLIWPVTSLGWVSSLIQRAAASQARINEFLKEKTEISSGTLAPRQIRGQLSFEGVSLSYRTEPALEDVSFSLEAGSSLAIVGRIGSGKTSLVQLACRLYDPAKGRILLDGAELRSYKLAYLRQQIGYVPQDDFLFSDTIASNIAFGLEGATEEQIRKAAQDAALLSTVESLEKGFDTLIGERGVMLSGGQKQRIAIARALIRNPRLLILDDCLSAVDTDTEHYILGSISRRMADCTTLIVSHRASSAKLVDQILVLDKGRVEALGTHSKLFLENSYYKEFYLTQLEEKETQSPHKSS